MKKYEILEHRADLKIRAFGKTKEELFSNLVLGMEESMKPEIASNEPITRMIKINSLDFPALLVDFLSEVLYLIQTNQEIYNNKVEFIKLTDTAIEAKLLGKKVASFGEEIKAVTHHSLEIKQATNKTWEAIVLFDV